MVVLLPFLGTTPFQLRDFVSKTPRPLPTASKASVVAADGTAGLELAGEMQASRPVSAWMLSMVMHCLLFVLLGITWRVIPKGAAIESDRKVGIVLVHEQQGKREYTDPNANDLAEDAAAAAAAVANAMPNQNEVPVDLSSALPGAAEVVAGGQTESLLDATDLAGDGTPRRGGREEGTSTEVFGVTGVGTNFVYVFDRSGSMENYSGRPLLAAKTELIRSLDDLDSTHQFQIIFYNEKPKIFTLKPGRAELIWGETDNKMRAKDFVARIKASGGTEHLNALQLALRMGPDVVFFLTDADQPQLTYGELQKVRRWNRGTTIHAIEFGSGPELSADNFLRKLARQNGGQHAYVDVRTLKVDRKDPLRRDGR